MNIAEIRKEPTVEAARPVAIDMKLEVIVIPVSDLDRAKRFYGDLGFSLDLDYTAGNGFRIEGENPVHDMVCAHLVGRVQIARFSRRLERTHDHPRGIGAKIKRLPLQEGCL